jgi:hypothetical protein
LQDDASDFLVGKLQETEINLDAAAIEASVIVENQKEVFEALSLIANSEDHKLILFGGNHAPETSLPTRQEKIDRSLKFPDSHPTKFSYSHSSIHRLTNGEGDLFKFGEAQVLIEHGDQHDSRNWISPETLSARNFTGGQWESRA